MPRGYRLSGARPGRPAGPPPSRHPRLVDRAAVRLLLGALALLGLAGADRGDALGDGDLEALDRARRVVEVGDGDAREALADRALDLAEVRLLVGRDERERVALQLGARRAAGAVDVVLGDVRNVEVHDVREGLDVDPARRDVRRDEDLELPVLEPGERSRALRLAPVAVDALAEDAVARELVREAVRAVLRAGEREDALEVAPLHEGEEEGELEVLGDGVDGLRDPDGRQGLPLDVHHDRI